MTTEEELDAARAAYKRVCEERDELRKAQGALYRERAHLTAFLAACYPSSTCTDWDDEYRILYVATPAGQMSWHVRAGDAEALLGHVPADEAAEWDGHTTEQKYGRLAELTRRLAVAGGVAGIIACVALPPPKAAERDEARSEAEAIREQAKRYLVAACGPDWLYRAPETFTGVERWIWAVANGQGPMAETAMAGIEQVCAERRAGSSRG